MVNKMVPIRMRGCPLMPKIEMLKSTGMTMSNITASPLIFGANSNTLGSEGNILINQALSGDTDAELSGTCDRMNTLINRPNSVKKAPHSFQSRDQLLSAIE